MIAALSFSLSFSCGASDGGPGLCRAQPEFVVWWGGGGSTDGSFWILQGIGISPKGEVYSADWRLERIQKFDNSGNFLLKWSLASFDGVYDVAIDHHDNVFVLEANNGHRVIKFTSDGAYQTSWGGQGSEVGALLNATHIAVDDSGFVYVSDSGNRRVQKFDTDGTFLLAFPTRIFPGGLDVDSSGSLYVAAGGFLQKFSASADLITEWTVRDVTGIAVGNDELVYAVRGGPIDGPDDVVVYDGAGVVVETWGGPGNQPGEFIDPRDIAIDKQGNIFIADHGAERISKFARPVRAEQRSFTSVKETYAR